MRGEVHRDVERVAQRLQRKRVAVGVKAAGHGADAHACACLHINSQRHGDLSLEDAIGRARINESICSDLLAVRDESHRQPDRIARRIVMRDGEG